MYHVASSGSSSSGLRSRNDPEHRVALKMLRVDLGREKRTPWPRSGRMWSAVSPLRRGVSYHDRPRRPKENLTVWPGLGRDRPAARRVRLLHSGAVRDERTREPGGSVPASSGRDCSARRRDPQLLTITPVADGSFLFHIDYDGKMASLEMTSHGRIRQAAGPRNTALIGRMKGLLVNVTSRFFSDIIALLFLQAEMLARGFHEWLCDEIRQGRVAWPRR